MTIQPAAKRGLVLEFTKMDGAGNDFVLLDNRFYAFSHRELAVLALLLCQRHTGVGADGLLALDHPESDEHPFRMRYINADGTLGTMCGNGARCIAAFAHDAGVADAVMRFESDAGPVDAEMLTPTDERGIASVQVVLATPRDYRTDRIPVVESALHRVTAVGYVWTGTEHVVYEVDRDLSEHPVGVLGKQIRDDAILSPRGANVNFVERLDASEAGEGRVRIRTYEKGVEAETRACGTGAIAVAVCGREAGWWSDGVVLVQSSGGTLTVRLPAAGENDERARLIGPARSVFRGSITVWPDELARAVPIN